MRVNLKGWKAARVYGAIGVIGLGVLACSSPPLESPQTTSVGVGRVYLPQNLKNKVDILFMIDNSNSMEAMSMALRNRFDDFFQPFRTLAGTGTFADLHVGVVTSDYGAGASAAPGCGMSPGGQQGRLQARGAKAAGNCKNPVMANYIQYIFGQGGSDGVNNLPAGQGLTETFTCMASVGAAGCGFEHPLESVYAALHNNLPDNVGFLRDEALLVVVFLTNEDDASAPPDSDIFDKNKGAMYGYEDSYSRQTRWAIQCGNPPAFPPYLASGGELAGCQSAPNLPTGAGPGKQFDISRYIDLFTKPQALGGVKPNPQDVLLVGIDAPETPFKVILSNPGTTAGQPYIECAMLNEASNPPCVPVLQHSCQNMAQPEFFGDPAVRLNTVIRSVKTNTVTSIASICDNDYKMALQATAKQIVSNLGGGCIPQGLPSDLMHPTCGATTDCGMNEVCGTDPKTQMLTCLKTDCSVEDSTINADGTTSVVEISACPNNGPNPGTTPCWRIEAKKPEVCGGGLSPNVVGLVIDRAGAPAPDHTTALVSCAFTG